MKNLVVIMLFAALGTIAQAKTRLARGLCVVAGHGPYDETESGCLKLAENQVVTNCILSTQDQKVAAELKLGKEKHLWNCSARYLDDKDDCRFESCK